MEDKYSNFNEKRMSIFNELVKRYWNGVIKTEEDLNALAEDIKEKYGFNESEIQFIRDHIRIAMGLDPKGDTEFSQELSLVKKARKIRHPVIAKVEGPCGQCEEVNCDCEHIGRYETQMYKREKSTNPDNDKGPVIDNNKCISCGQCVSKCNFGALADKIEFIPLVDLLKDGKTPVYATVAPAIVGQFGEKVSMGKLRTALKLLGFEDMIEVALFADILTIKEALEFNHLVKNEEDFFLTSCCCPIWFNMIKKSYPDVYKHLSPSVSPMVASGRILKELYENAKVVFIGPCIAKKAESKERDLADAIDYVLNFRELQEIFDALNVNLEELPEDDKDQASMGGRLYARTGGVSFSVKTIVNRLEPRRVIKLKAKKVDGVKNCKKILDDLRDNKKVGANFIEGMACAGGCVGGPRTNIDVDKATKLVNDFGEDSFILTPFDNFNVRKILEQLGVSSVEDVVESKALNRMLSR